MEKGVLITCRSGSFRFPQKYRFNLPKLYPRAQQSGLPVCVVHPDLEVGEYCESHQMEHAYVPPDDRDVTRQLLGAMEALKWDAAALVCGDSPCVDPADITWALDLVELQGPVWVNPLYDGLWVRAFTYASLKGLMDSREHGVNALFAPQGKLYGDNLGIVHDLSVDTAEDAEFITYIYRQVSWDAPKEEILKCASEVKKLEGTLRST